MTQQIEAGQPGTLIPRTIDGHDVAQRRSDGYVNATALCKAAGKRLTHYIENQSTRAFLGEMESVAGNPATLLVQIRQGGVAGEQGTWVHPDVAINLAQWCSPRFAVQVSRWVRELMTTGPVSVATATPPDQAATVFAAAIREMGAAIGSAVTGLAESNRRLVTDVVGETVKAVMAEMSASNQRAAAPAANPLVPNNEEKRRMAVHLLTNPATRDQSARDLAKLSGLSDNFISAVRRQLAGTDPDPVKARAARTGNARSSIFDILNGEMNGG